MAAGQWVKFFNASGIPASAAATYAHIFVENRIQNDMLMDINKEHLREMGITLMGDIIAILRHAKHVSDQTARERVLNGSDASNHIPVAAVSANPATPNINTAKMRLSASANVGTSTSAAVVSPMKVERNRSVMPLEEGGYTVKLPSGSTERSKAILAKQAKLYEDMKITNEKNNVFKRLKSNDAEPMNINLEHSIISTANHEEKKMLDDNGSIQKNNTPSIFSRLGGKDDYDMPTTGGTKEIKPILKKTAKNRLSTIVKAKASPPVVIKTGEQKVLLVKKVPTKSCDNDIKSIVNNNKFNDDIPVTGEKIVKFASTAEVCEISNVDRLKMAPALSKRKVAIVNINRGDQRLHSVEHKTNMKHVSPLKYRKEVMKMIADDVNSNDFNCPKSVHKRLGFINGTTTKTDSGDAINKRQNNLSHNSSTFRSFFKHQTTKKSVFDRLGFQ